MYLDCMFTTCISRVDVAGYEGFHISPKEAGKYLNCVVGGAEVAASFTLA